MTLRGQLSTPVGDINSVALTRASTLEGVNLLPPSSARKRASFSSVHTATNATFDVHLHVPPMNSKGLAEIAGYLECESAGNRRNVELFSGKLGEGAKGGTLSTEIESIGPNASGGESIVLRSDFNLEQVLSLKVIGEAGQTAQLQRQGTMKFGNKRSWTFTAKGAIP